jgi:hypothetical protein
VNAQAALRFDLRGTRIGSAQAGGGEKCTGGVRHVDREKPGVSSRSGRGAPLAPSRCATIEFIRGPISNSLDELAETEALSWQNATPQEPVEKASRSLRLVHVFHQRQPG